MLGYPAVLGDSKRTEAHHTCVSTFEAMTTELETATGMVFIEDLLRTAESQQAPFPRTKAHLVSAAVHAEHLLGGEELRGGISKRPDRFELGTTGVTASCQRSTLPGALLVRLSKPALLLVALGYPTTCCGLGLLGAAHLGSLHVDAHIHDPGHRRVCEGSDLGVAPVRFGQARGSERVIHAHLLCELVAPEVRRFDLVCSATEEPRAGLDHHRVGSRREIHLAQRAE